MNRLRPQDTYGEYRLIRKLGLGGMAEVWLAEPLTTWHRYPFVVLKRVHAHLSEDARTRTMFLDEARLAARLNHVNIVRVLDVGELDSELFMTMELIDGLDLRACMDLHHGPLWPAFAAALIADACAGLHYAHTLKSLEGKPLRVVHRDIAPDNMMVDVTGRVRLVDFGVARADTTEVTTQTGLRKGKARYMSPEYLLEHQATPKSDVYSMAATLFELVTGQKPHGDRAATPDVIAAIVEHGLPRADLVRPSLPPSLVQLIADASMHDVKKRLPSAKAFEDRLREFLDEFRPPSSAEIGAEVAMWKKKRGGQLKLPKRFAGSFGQLESTEVVQGIAHTEVTPVLGTKVSVKARSVEVAHALERTELEVRAPVEEVTDPTLEAPTAPYPAVRAATGSHNVILSPDLEAVATRTRTKRKKKKKRSP